MGDFGIFDIKEFFCSVFILVWLKMMKVSYRLLIVLLIENFYSGFVIMVVWGDVRLLFIGEERWLILLSRRL